MPAYEVWVEGYATTGQPAPASCLGAAVADTFEAACAKVAWRNNWGADYDPVKNTFWGCHLFDNAVDARRSFG